MVERIEKIARVKGIESETGRRFDKKNNYRDGEGDGSFAGTLKRVMKKHEEDNGVFPEAYKLELTSTGANTLFHFHGWNMGQLLGN